MNIAVLGCGAIGGLMAGYLTKSGRDVSVAARAHQVHALRSEGMHIEGAQGNHRVPLEVDTRLRRKPEFAIFATKIGDLEEVIKENLKAIENYPKP